MGRKRTPGLFKRSGIWHIDKQINGRRICQSTGYAELEKAEAFLAKLVEEKLAADESFRIFITLTNDILAQLDGH